MKGNIKDYLEQTNTVLLTKDAFEYLKEKACAIDKARVEICQLHSYVAKFAGGSFAIHIDKEKVLQIIDKYQAESEPQESEDDTWSLKDVTDALKRHGFLQEQESCEDAISRQAAIDTLDTTDKFMDEERTVETYKALLKECYEVLPSVTPKQKVGKWIYTKAVSTGEIIWSECSVCGEGEHGCAKRMKFCPNCGARMGERSEKE